jgi:activator of HSP90 ATPase
VANALYPLYKQSLLAGDANADLDVNDATDGPFCALVDTGTYTYNTAHDFYNDLSGIVGTDQRITAPTVTTGLFDGTDLTYTAVSGNSVEALVVYRHNAGANTTWRLVMYMDTGVTGLPVTPNGGNINVTWNASGIFQL